MTEAPVITLLQQLVRVPSVNPLLNADPAIGGEQRMADCLATLLTGLGFTVEWHEILPGRPNIVARFGPRSARKSFLFESHLDTQSIDGMTVPPFEGVIKDNRIYGRGACDMKGSTAASLAAMDRPLLDRIAESGTQLIYIGAIGEEKGNAGAEQLANLGIGADEAIVLEPTDLNIVLAHKGALWFEVELHGRAAHGSTPDQGINAIAGMGEVVSVLQRLTAARGKNYSNALLGSPTVNIGIIRGGSSINIVPDRCVIEVDRRMLPAEKADEILGEIRCELTGIQNAGRISGWDLRIIHEGQPFETVAECALVRRMVASAADEGVTSQRLGAGWFSDAGSFCRTCKHIAVFGPGSIRQAHTADEYIEISELLKGTAIIRRFLERLAKGDAAK